MRIETNSLVKEYVVTKNIDKVILTNKITNKVISYDRPNEFVIGFNMKKFFTSIEYIKSSECDFIREKDNVLEFQYIDCLSREWKIRLFNQAVGEEIKTHIEFDCVDNDVVIDSVEYFNIPVDNDKYQWSKPVLKEFVLIPPYWATLGQPVYYDSLFMGVEFPTADNQILDGRVSLKIYYGREIACRDKVFTAHTAVLGASRGDNIESHKYSFFKYVDTFARPRQFRLQYNSWYDNMLDITPENINSSFREVHEGLKNSGLRDLDCYVIDDGWVDYKAAKFWAFNDKFKDGLAQESELTRSLGSTFGLWIGPRGGYSEAYTYALKLKKIGYHVNRQAMDICVADPHYIASLGELMENVIKDYQVTYFKLDGFVTRPCNNKKHGHIVGGYKDMYFYTNLWENWFAAFDRVRALSPDVFLNVTSYANVSPWMLIHADALWMNNAGDMNYEGEGGNLDQCLSYRDGRYYDLFNVRQLQFPNAYIYNHEPCYAERNYNPPLPSASHKTVVYTDAEFEQYLTMCMMRGSGFVEMYYSPKMFDGDKWNINARVMKWAEANFELLSKSIYFGGIPKNGEVYGYIASGEKSGYIAIRNPHAKAQDFTLNTTLYTHSDSEMTLAPHFGDLVGVHTKGGKIDFALKPFEMKVVKFDIK